VNLQQTLDRWLSFVERRLEDGILAAVRFPVSQAEPPEPVRIRGCLALEDPDGSVSRTRGEIESLRHSLSDNIPSAYPTFDFGEAVWAGFLGGDITFAGNHRHTWSHCDEPPVKDLSVFEFPPVPSDNPWLKKMLAVTEYFVNHMEPICDVTPFIFVDCLNLLIELRGIGGYTDLHDCPETVGRFMDWSVEVNMHVYEAQAELLRDLADRAFQGHPFRRYSRSRIPNLSVDAYGMCNPNVYERSGLGQHQRIVSHYGGGILHVHGNGRNLCGLVSRNEGLTYCYMGDDAGYPEACDIVAELKERMSPVPIAVDIPTEKFLNRLNNRSLPAGVLYRLSANSLREANQIMLRVFDYSPRRR